MCEKNLRWIMLMQNWIILSTHSKIYVKMSSSRKTRTKDLTVCHFFNQLCKWITVHERVLCAFHFMDLVSAFTPTRNWILINFLPLLCFSHSNHDEWCEGKAAKSSFFYFSVSPLNLFKIRETHTHGMAHHTLFLKHDILLLLLSIICCVHAIHS